MSGSGEPHTPGRLDGPATIHEAQNHIRAVAAKAATGNGHVDDGDVARSRIARPAHAGEAGGSGELVHEARTRNDRHASARRCRQRRTLAWAPFERMREAFVRHHPHARACRDRRKYFARLRTRHQVGKRARIQARGITPQVVRGHQWLLVEHDVSAGLVAPMVQRGADDLAIGCRGRGSGARRHEKRHGEQRADPAHLSSAAVACRVRRALPLPASACPGGTAGCRAAGRGWRRRG